MKWKFKKKDFKGYFQDFDEELPAIGWFGWSTEVKAIGEFNNNRLDIAISRNGDITFYLILRSGKKWHNYKLESVGNSVGQLTSIVTDIVTRLSKIRSQSGLVIMGFKAS